MKLTAWLLIASLAAWPLQPLDDAVQRWILAHQDPRMHSVMQVITNRSRPVLFGAAALGLFSGPAGRLFVGELALALAPVNLAVEGLKRGIGRTRPDGDAHRANSSFPSSHAANAFTVAAVLTRRWKWASVPVWLAAAVVAFSRMYLDRHWLSDVLGSLLLAAGGAWFAAWVVERWRARRAAPRTA